MTARRSLVMAGTLVLMGIGACFPEIPELVADGPAGGSGGSGAAGGAGGTGGVGGASGAVDGGGTGGGGTGAVDSGGTDSGGTDSGGTDSGGTDSGGTDSGGSEAGPDVGLGGAGEAGPACPPDMVHATDSLIGASFCVDRTEVTQAQYLQFLAAVQSDPAKTDQPPECAFNNKLTNTPDGTCPSFTSASDVPVFCVDWCDAYAYCAFRGKRLCGALGGGTLALDGPLTNDEWHYACTGAFTTTYPYGNSAIVGACHIPQENTPTDSSDDATKAPVGSYPDCEGGFPGIFDMQGNVAEWTDRCEPGDGSGEENCMTRGGHTYGAAVYWRCNNLVGTAKRNDADKREFGIRCCGNAQ